MKRHPRKVGALCAGAIAVALLAPVANGHGHGPCHPIPTDTRMEHRRDPGGRHAAACCRENPDHRLRSAERLEEVVDAGATDVDDRRRGRARDHRASSRVPSGVTYGSFAQTPDRCRARPAEPARERLPTGAVPAVPQGRRQRDAVVQGHVTQPDRHVHDNERHLGPALSGVPGDESAASARATAPWRAQLIFSIRAYRGQQHLCTKRPAAPSVRRLARPLRSTTNEFDCSFSTGPLCGPSSTSTTRTRTPASKPGWRCSIRARTRDRHLAMCRSAATFTVRSDAITTSYDRRIQQRRRADTSGVRLVHRRTRRTTGRAELLEQTGLTRVGNPQLETPPDPTPEPAECPMPGPTPSAGTLQFDAKPSPTVGEWAEPGAQRLRHAHRGEHRSGR